MKTLAMSRGILVLDENSLDLGPELQRKNIRVIKPVKGMEDETIAEALASGRIIVTKNTKDFLQFAIEYEFGIIDIDTASLDTKTVAQHISNAIREHSLWGKNGAFVVHITKNGSSKFKELKE